MIASIIRIQSPLNANLKIKNKINVILKYSVALSRFDV
jgi:hypothetical protein